jgi:membrane-bound serine protease (ClpP class)
MFQVSKLIRKHPQVVNFRMLSSAHQALAFYGLICTLLVSSTSQLMTSTALAQENAAASGRQGHLVEVPLPLVGDRGENVKRQIEQIAKNAGKLEQPPVVVLHFRAVPLAVAGTNSELLMDEGLLSRGSPFERCLELSRYLSGSAAARVRLVAYLPASVEGHAVLPVLACAEIISAPSAELGRAAADEAVVDAFIESAYREIVQRRQTLPLPVVLSMLNASQEVYKVQLADGTSTVVGQTEVNELRKAGKVVREETLWTGGNLAAYSGQMMRNERWIDRTISGFEELGPAIGLTNALRTPQQLPSEWRPMMLTITSKLTSARVNQLIRGISEQTHAGEVNSIIIKLQDCDASFEEASRLASYIAELESDKVFTIGLISGVNVGAATLIPLACDEVVLIAGGSLGPDDKPGHSALLNTRSTQLVLNNLEQETGRPAAFLSSLLDADVTVKEYIHQDTGRRAAFADWQIETNEEANKWLAKESIAGGGPIDPATAIKYRLIDGIEETEAIALSRLGIDTVPPEFKLPWIDAGIQKLLAQSWLPRLLLTIGFFALMAELGSPGIGVGGFLSALCFLGFFWIEGLNGNVEWLEVLLFIAGLVALAIELFVLPGFGVFGIGGLMMLLVSIVLASQTFIWPTTSAQLNEFSMNLFWVAFMALGGMIGLLLMHKQFERLPMLRWVTLEPVGAADLDDLESREALVHYEHLLGQDGVTKTRLNPSGKAQFGRHLVGVIGIGKMIDEGTAVRVVEVRGNMIFVEAME